MSIHTTQIRRWFEIQARSPGRRTIRRQPLPPAPVCGRILWITGPSGSGKSTLLRRILKRHGQPVININRMTLRPIPVIDGFASLPTDQALALLCRVGLGEVWTWLKHPAQLSAGQRFRLRAALAIHQATAHAASLIVCDEFASCLDPVTAAVTARCVRRLVSASTSFGAILAGSRQDLIPALSPDQIIECDFGTWTLHPRP